MKKSFFACLFALIIAVLGLTACESEASHVSFNISKEADNFNVTRRLTVINSRSDKRILQMVGKMSIEDVTDGIAVLIELDRDKHIYQKHYIYLNDWTMYTVEDVSGVGVSRYAYEMEFMPQSIVPVKITANELKEDAREWAVYDTEEEKRRGESNGTSWRTRSGI